MQEKGKNTERVGFVLVLLMALLQGIYAAYAYFDPQSFSLLRGTVLIAEGDRDWVQIYASRTLFVALIIGWLLLLREYKILFFASLFGTVMPITDAVLAFQTGAASAVVYKHCATVIYLLITCLVLRKVIERKAAE